MLLSRKIGSFLRGNATPGQVFTAAMLASLLGFIPGFFLPGDLGGGFLQAPGLILSLLFLVIVLNANMGVFGLVTLVAKLVSFLTLPLASAIGNWLIHGPTEGLVKSLVNAPITAWFGLHYYATAGGLLLGLVFGTISGSVFVKSLQMFRVHMAKMEQGNETYQKASQSKWLRLITWLLLGKRKTGKLSYQEMLDGQKKALPVRIGGIVLVILIAGSLYAFQGWYASPMLASSVRSGLLSTNGATVDLDSAVLDLAGGSIKFTNLAIADSKALDKNLFAATALEAAIDTKQLLRRRFVIDRLHSANATSGETRAVPGKLTAQPKPTPPAPVPAGTKTIEDYLKDAGVWQARLSQAKEWIEWLTANSEQPAPPGAPPEAIEQQRQKEIAVVGYARAAANDMIADVPSFLIRAIDFEGVISAQLGEPVDLKVTNLSNNVWLLKEPPQVSLKTKSGNLDIQLTGPSAAVQGVAVALVMKAIPIDTLFGQLKVFGSAPLHGGTLDFATKGGLQAHAGKQTTCELPLQVTLRKTTLALGGKETPIDSLLLPIAISGEVTRPSVGIQDKALADALLAAGKKELADFVNAQAGKLFAGVGIPGLGEVIDPKKTPTEMLEAAKAKAATEAAALKQKLADEAKVAAEKALKQAATDGAKKATEDAAKQGLKNLLPGFGKKQ
ncbi:MAG: hypothetical protein NT107_03040 [Planctomycetota bacterium]|nr:hypothetical protein [Planctomycetota bacterium]